MSLASADAPALAIVTIADRPDLAPLVTDWLWEAFWRAEGATRDHVAALVAGAAARVGPPQCFVLLADGDPVGTASLVAHDLDARPELAPWLAGVFVIPAARRNGYVGHLIEAVETAARTAGLSPLWLYTNGAERIYAKAGWRTVDYFDHFGLRHALMRRDF